MSKFSDALFAVPRLLGSCGFFGVQELSLHVLRVEVSHRLVIERHRADHVLSSLAVNAVRLVQQEDHLQKDRVCCLD